MKAPESPAFKPRRRILSKTSSLALLDSNVKTPRQNSHRRVESQIKEPDSSPAQQSPIQKQATQLLNQMKQKLAVESSSNLLPLDKKNLKYDYATNSFKPTNQAVLNQISQTVKQRKKAEKIMALQKEMEDANKKVVTNLLPRPGQIPLRLKKEDEEDEQSPEAFFGGKMSAKQKEQFKITMKMNSLASSNDIIPINYVRSTPWQVISNAVISPKTNQSARFWKELLDYKKYGLCIENINGYQYYEGLKFPFQIRKSSDMSTKEKIKYGLPLGKSCLYKPQLQQSVVTPPAAKNIDTGIAIHKHATALPGKLAKGLAKLKLADSSPDSIAMRKNSGAIDEDLILSNTLKQEDFNEIIAGQFKVNSPDASPDGDSKQRSKEVQISSATSFLQTPSSPEPKLRKNLPSNRRNSRRMLFKSSSRFVAPMTTKVSPTISGGKKLSLEGRARKVQFEKKSASNSKNATTPATATTGKGSKRLGENRKRRHTIREAGLGRLMLNRQDASAQNSDFDQINLIDDRTLLRMRKIKRAKTKKLTAPPSIMVNQAEIEDAEVQQRNTTKIDCWTQNSSVQRSDQGGITHQNQAMKKTNRVISKRIHRRSKVRPKKEIVSQAQLEYEEAMISNHNTYKMKPPQKIEIAWINDLKEMKDFDSFNGTSSRKELLQTQTQTYSYRQSPREEEGIQHFNSQLKQALGNQEMAGPFKKKRDSMSAAGFSRTANTNFVNSRASSQFRKLPESANQSFYHSKKNSVGGAAEQGSPQKYPSQNDMKMIYSKSQLMQQGPLTSKRSSAAKKRYYAFDSLKSQEDMENRGQFSRNHVRNSQERILQPILLSKRESVNNAATLYRNSLINGSVSSFSKINNNSFQNQPPFYLASFPVNSKSAKPSPQTSRLQERTQEKNRKRLLAKLKEAEATATEPTIQTVTYRP